MIDKTKYEFGIMSSRFLLEADNKLTAYAAMLIYFNFTPNLIALYEPKEVVKNDQWLNSNGEIADRIDSIFGGEGAFEKYLDKHDTEIRNAYYTIRQIS